jgi:hypothetical protein
MYRQASSASDSTPNCWAAINTFSRSWASFNKTIDHFNIVYYPNLVSKKKKDYCSINSCEHFPTYLVGNRRRRAIIFFLAVPDLPARRRWENFRLPLILL